VGGQQVLHDVQTLGAVKVGGLGGQHLQLVGGDRQGKAFAAVTGGGGTGDPSSWITLAPLPSFSAMMKSASLPPATLSEAMWA
jgi:hypothetical protein